MQKPSRRSIGARRNPATAEAILVAAQDVLRERGYAGFSIEAVARRARAGKPTIYRWWHGKAALLLDIYHRQKGDMALLDTGDLEADLAVFIMKILHHWRDTPAGNVFRSILAEAQQDEQAAEAVRAYSLDRIDHIASVLENSQGRGALAPDIAPKTAAEFILAFLWTRLVTHRLDASEEEARAAMHCLMHGATAR